MKTKILRLFIICLLCLGTAQFTQAEMPKKSQGRVSDFAKILDTSVKEQIQGLSNQVESVTGAQMAVVTVESLDGLTVEEYANKLFNLWGIGHKGKDDGILLLVATKDRKARIEVGYGLESTINDGKAGPDFG